MKKQINQVKEFHKVFNLTESQNYKLNQGVCLMRYLLALEELQEYLIGCGEKNEVEIADALGDQLYILLGTIISHGLEDKIEAIFDEIHRSNMTKLDADGKPLYREDGKVKKSDLYEEPDIESILVS